MVDIIRRRLIKAGSLTLASGLMPRALYAHSHQRKIIFGYGTTGLGTPLGKGVCECLDVHTQTNYEFGNYPGQHSELACNLVRDAAPDGSMLLLAKSPSFNLFPNVYKHLTYKLSDFKPLAQLGRYTLVLVVGPLVPKNVTNIDQLSEWISDNPQYRGIGFTFYQSPGHIAELIFARAKTLALQPVAYVGTSMIIRDLIDQNLAVALVASGNGSDFYQSNLLRPLAVTTHDRFKPLPQVETFAERGVEQMDLSGWYGLMASYKTPSGTSTQMVNQLQQLSRQNDFKNLIAGLNLAQGTFDPDEFTEQIKAETQYMSYLVKEYKIQSTPST